jgi:hypothetical protein
MEAGEVHFDRRSSFAGLWSDTECNTGKHKNLPRIPSQTSLQIKPGLGEARDEMGSVFMSSRPLAKP